MISFIFLIVFNAGTTGERVMESPTYDTAQQCRNARPIAKMAFLNSANEVYITECYRQLNY